MSRIFYQPQDERYNLNNYVSPYIWYDPSPYKDIMLSDPSTLAYSTNSFDNKITAFTKNLSEISSDGTEALFSPDQANGICTWLFPGSTVKLLSEPITGFTNSYFDLGFTMAASFNADILSFGSDNKAFVVSTGSSNIWVGVAPSSFLCGSIQDTNGSKLYFEDKVSCEFYNPVSSKGSVSVVFMRKIKNSYTVQLGINNRPIISFTNSHYTTGLKTITYRGIALGSTQFDCIGECFLLLDEQPDGVFTDLRKYYVKKWRGEDL